jgi:hypothetical protein
LIKDEEWLDRPNDSAPVSEHKIQVIKPWLYGVLDQLVKAMILAPGAKSLLPWRAFS